MATVGVKGLTNAKPPAANLSEAPRMTPPDCYHSNSSSSSNRLLNAGDITTKLCDTAPCHFSAENTERELDIEEIRSA